MSENKAKNNPLKNLKTFKCHSCVADKHQYFD